MYFFFEARVQIVQYNNTRACKKNIVDRLQLRLQSLSINNLFESTCKPNSRFDVDKSLVNSVETNELEDKKLKNKKLEREKLCYAAI